MSIIYSKSWAIYSQLRITTSSAFVLTKKRLGYTLCFPRAQDAAKELRARFRMKTAELLATIEKLLETDLHERSGETAGEVIKKLGWKLREVEVYTRAL